MSENEEIRLSPAMQRDLEALMRGLPLPDRDWDERPWKAGELCWVTFAGKGGDSHTYPAVVTRYRGPATGEDSTPMDFALDSHDGEPMLLPHPEYARVIRAEPRLEDEVLLTVKTDRMEKQLEELQRVACEVVRTAEPLLEAADPERCTQLAELIVSLRDTLEPRRDR